MAVQYSQPHLFSIPCVYLRYTFLALLSYINQLYVWVYIQAFYSFHWCICLLLGKYHTVLITMGLQNSLNPGTMLYPGLFLLKNSVAIWVLLFHINLRIFFLSHFCKICHWNFDRDCIQSVDTLCSMDILTILLFQSLSVEYLEIYLCLFQLITSVSFSF